MEADQVWGPGWAAQGRGQTKAQGCRRADLIAPLAMSNHDLELGLLPSTKTSWEGNGGLKEAKPLDSSWLPLETSNQEEIDHQPGHVQGGIPVANTAIAESKGTDNPAQDEYIAGVPRKKVEQLVKLWIEVVQGSLVDDNGQGSKAATALRPEEYIRQKSESRLLTSSLNKPRPPPFKVEAKTSQTGGWVQIGNRDQVNYHNLELWSERDIIAEDERRRAIRQEWKISEDYQHLEDCWENLWEPKPGVDKGLFQWSCSDERRKILQLDLADALNANGSIVVVGLYMRRDFRAIAPWISLIGLRLNELYRTIYQGARVSPMTQIEILIECIWCCNSFRPEFGDMHSNQSPQIGDVLSACYQRRILEEPKNNPLLGGIILREQYQHVRTALYLVSLLYKHRIPTFHRSENLEDTWETSLSTAEAAMREYPTDPELEKGTDSFFRVDDFNVRDLQSLGHLQLQWTSHWDEHLQLETSSTANIIKVYWFQPSLAQFLVQNRLCTKIQYGERERREKEISATWSIIFTSNSSEKEAQKWYQKLMAPPWLSLLAHNTLKTWDSEQEAHETPGPNMSRLLDKPMSSKFCFEAADHLRLRWSKNRRQPQERMSYSQFPIYETRLRQLRSYMDSQQPKGLGALWKDRRNSNTYYTFWFVTIFGCLSVFLATCGLAVSIVQTWAQLRSLPPSNL